jgi:hypothetical protein
MESAVPEQPELPRRRPGSHLPAAVKAVGVAKVPTAGDRWHADERSLTVLLNALRRWEPTT